MTATPRNQKLTDEERKALNALISMLVMEHQAVALSTVNNTAKYIHRRVEALANDFPEVAQRLKLRDKHLMPVTLQSPEINANTED